MSQDKDKLQQIELTICTDFTKLKAQDLVWLVERVKLLETKLDTAISLVREMGCNSVFQDQCIPCNFVERLSKVSIQETKIQKHKDVHLNGDET